MTTTKQLLANRRNAKKSTGPKTLGGKLMSSKNAITYGIFSTSPLLPGESKEEFEALKQGVAEIYPPIDMMAVSMVERIALAILRQQRLRRAEAAKLKISMTPEVLAKDVGRTLGGIHSLTVTPERISEEQERAYQYWLTVSDEFATLNISGVPGRLGELSTGAPNVWVQLKEEAKKSSLNYDVFMKSPTHIIKALESTKSYAREFVETNAIYHKAYGLAEQFKIAKLIPDIEELALLSKYQVQLDTDLERAIEAYKKHVAWRSEVLEVEVEDAEISESEPKAIAA
jgi:hypothetical protein